MSIFNLYPKLPSKRIWTVLLACTFCFSQETYAASFIGSPVPSTEFTSGQSQAIAPANSMKTLSTSCTLAGIVSETKPSTAASPSLSESKVTDTASTMFVGSSSISTGVDAASMASINRTYGQSISSSSVAGQPVSTIRSITLPTTTTSAISSTYIQSASFSNTFSSISRDTSASRTTSWPTQTTLGASQSSQIPSSVITSSTVTSMVTGLGVSFSSGAGSSSSQGLPRVTIGNPGTTESFQTVVSFMEWNSMLSVVASATSLPSSVGSSTALSSKLPTSTSISEISSVTVAEHLTATMTGSERNTELTTSFSSISAQSSHTVKTDTEWCYSFESGLRCTEMPLSPVVTNSTATVTTAAAAATALLEDKLNCYNPSWVSSPRNPPVEYEVSVVIDALNNTKPQDMPMNKDTLHWFGQMNNCTNCFSWTADYRTAGVGLDPTPGLYGDGDYMARLIEMQRIINACTHTTELYDDGGLPAGWKTFATGGNWMQFVNDSLFRTRAVYWDVVLGDRGA